MSLYKQPGSDVWWARFTVNGERVRVPTGEYVEKEAQKVHDRLKADQHDQPKLKGRTWGSAVLKWTEEQVRSDSDIQSLIKFSRYYKDRTLSSVTADSIDAALKKFIKAEGTYNRYIARISAVLNLSKVNIKFTKKRDKNAKVRDWITQEQWAKLYLELPAHQRVMASFGMYTGLRQANVLGLRWDHVDLERRMAWIDGHEMKGIKPPPLGIPLGEEAINVLTAVQGVDDEFVFTYRGRQIKEIKTAFHAACIRAGVGRMADDIGPVEAGMVRPTKGLVRYQGLTWHGLRHSWATWHAQSGTPMEVLKELGGWTDMRMLQKHYAHHVPGIKAKYADNIGIKK